VSKKRIKKAHFLEILGQVMRISGSLALASQEEVVLTRFKKRSLAKEKKKRRLFSPFFKIDKSPLPTKRRINVKKPRSLAKTMRE